MGRRSSGIEFDVDLQPILPEIQVASYEFLSGSGPGSIDVLRGGVSPIAFMLADRREI